MQVHPTPGPCGPFALGRFRLPCGDAAIREAVNRLLDGVRADQRCTRANAMEQTTQITPTTINTRS